MVRPFKILGLRLFTRVCDLKNNEGWGARKIAADTGLTPGFASQVMNECDDPVAAARRTGQQPPVENPATKQLEPVPLEETRTVLPTSNEAVQSRTSGGVRPVWGKVPTAKDISNQPVVSPTSTANSQAQHQTQPRLISDFSKQTGKYLPEELPPNGNRLNRFQLPIYSPTTSQPSTQDTYLSSNDFTQVDTDAYRFFPTGGLQNANSTPHARKIEDFPSLLSSAISEVVESIPRIAVNSWKRGMMSSIRSKFNPPEYQPTPPPEPTPPPRQQQPETQCAQSSVEASFQELTNMIRSQKQKEGEENKKQLQGRTQQIQKRINEEFAKMNAPRSDEPTTATVGVPPNGAASDTGSPPVKPPAADPAVEVQPDEKPPENGVHLPPATDSSSVLQPVVESSASSTEAVDDSKTSEPKTSGSASSSEALSLRTSEPAAQPTTVCPCPLGKSASGIVTGASSNPSIPTADTQLKPLTSEGQTDVSSQDTVGANSSSMQAKDGASGNGLWKVVLPIILGGVVVAVATYIFNPNARQWMLAGFRRVVSAAQGQFQRVTQSTTAPPESAPALYSVPIETAQVGAALQQGFRARRPEDVVFI